jgi:hypothetical protein
VGVCGRFFQQMRSSKANFNNASSEGEALSCRSGLMEAATVENAARATLAGRSSKQVCGSDLAHPEVCQQSQ